MNMAYDYSPENEFENEREISYNSGKEKINSQRRTQASHIRGKKGPAQFNGMHRRRNKRFSW